MKTSVDNIITAFMEHMLEEDVDITKMSNLLDQVRRFYDLDIVFIMEKEPDNKNYVYKLVSASKPEYDVTGQVIVLTDEEFDVVMHMYDDSPVCDSTVASAREAGIAEATLHYGFISKRTGIYDGSIGFQCFRPHTWSEDEREVLIKLGRLYQMITGISASENIFEYMYAKLEAERQQYRAALTDGSEYSFTMDITDGFLREKIFLPDGSDLLETIHIPLPASYDKIIEVMLKDNEIEIAEEEMRAVFSCKGLLELYEKGKTNPEAEYYSDPLKAHIRVTVFMYKDENTGHIWGLFMAANITEARERREAQRKALEDAYEAANQANIAKSQFLSNMSHDIRTPLNGIIGMTAIADTHLDDTARVKDCLAKITLASKHLLALINDVLDMSKIESGRIELQDEEFELHELLDNIIHLSRSSVEAKGHDLNVVARDIVHERVIGDRNRLEQVLLNFLNNAVKYTPNGGKIRVALTEIPLRNRPKVGCYEFVFEDNGIGMSQEFVEHIFEPFARANDSRIAQIQGTGLGMPIAKNTIQMMDGTIQVESELNKGSKFTVTVFLELQQADQALLDAKFIDLPVLVVDDDETACQSTCAILAELGMKGEYVLSGKEAIERVTLRQNAGEGYFVVILDWKMPGMDGLETAKYIRNTIGNDVPIIILSAYDWSDIESEAKAAGVNGFLGKPLFKSKVSYVLNGLLGNEEKRSETALDDILKEDFSGKRVLLVEDNELNAEIAGEILGMANFEVEFAENGQVAVDKIKTMPAGYYDLIFMDIQMPIMNGLEATKTIRAIPRADIAALPIIAMSANAFTDDIKKSKDAGMNDHIAKPIDFGKLITTINRWLK